ncbi:MAG TPA: cold shock domain-containing protein [Xanthomarina sp.]|nr:cold shock domain-containing protein [Xanthomarina sp.]
MIKKIFNKLIGKKKESQTKEGTVKFFNNAKGFGFIIQADSDVEVFVHKNDLIDKIRENDKVIFEIEQGKKGLNAVNVKLA